MSSFTGWALAGSLKCCVSPLFILSPFFSPLLGVFAEGAKLCGVWAGGSTRGQRTFPQAPDRAEQGVQEKCPWGESITLAPIISAPCVIFLIFTSVGTRVPASPLEPEPPPVPLEPGIIYSVITALGDAWMTAHTIFVKSELTPPSFFCSPGDIEMLRPCTSSLCPVKMGNQGSFANRKAPIGVPLRSRAKNNYLDFQCFPS